MLCSRGYTLWRSVGPKRYQSTVNEFKQAFRQYPQPVVLIAGENNGVARGIIVSSLTSLSLNPPMVTFNVKIPSRALETMQTRFVAHFLTHTEAHINLAKLFSDPEKEQDERQWIQTARGPQLKDKCTRLSCRTIRQIEVSDHCIVIGKVVAIELEPPQLGLVYRDHSFLPVK